jgi:hypothetical protein
MRICSIDHTLPVHRLAEHAANMETTGSYLKRHQFTSLSRLIARTDHGKRRQAAALQKHFSGFINRIPLNTKPEKC